MAVDRPATSHSTWRGSDRSSSDAAHDSGSDDDVFGSNARPKSTRRAKTTPHTGHNGIALVRTLRRTFTSSLHSLVSKGSEEKTHEDSNMGGKTRSVRSASPGVQ
ncbi:hypothetical protein GGI05_005839, partial [Coemansia sp. RSA 2603]